MRFTVNWEDERPEAFYGPFYHSLFWRNSGLHICVCFCSEAIQHFEQHPGVAKPFPNNILFSLPFCLDSIIITAKKRTCQRQSRSADAYSRLTWIKLIVSRALLKKVSFYYFYLLLSRLFYSQNHEWGRVCKWQENVLCIPSLLSMMITCIR